MKAITKQNLTLVSALLTLILTGCGQGGFSPLQQHLNESNPETVKAIASIKKAHSAPVNNAIRLVGGASQFSQLSVTHAPASSTSASSSPLPSSLPSQDAGGTQTLPSMPSMPSVPTTSAGGAAQMPDLSGFADQMKAQLIQLIDQNASALQNLPDDAKKQLQDAVAQVQAAQSQIDVSKLPTDVQSLIQANNDILAALEKAIK